VPLLLVDGLPLSWTELKLREWFERHGTVSNAVLLTGPLGGHIGFGYVEMVDPAEAEQARQALDGTQIGGHRITVVHADQT
jgi:RNA recognition motif-containing protein